MAVEAAVRTAPDAPLPVCTNSQVTCVAGVKAEAADFRFVPVLSHDTWVNGFSAEVLHDEWFRGLELAGDIGDWGTFHMVEG